MKQPAFQHKKILSVAIGAFLLACVAFPMRALLASYGSAGFSIYNPINGAGGGMSAGGTFRALQSIGQSIVGKSASSHFQVWSGFEYFPTVGTMTLSGSGGTQQASFSWNALPSFNGHNIDHYEFGIGAISGSYVFEPIGIATTFVKTGLSNSTQYYAIIKAVSTSGKTLAFSNEVQATTGASAVTPPDNGNGGGGGGGGGGGAGGGTTNAGGGTVGTGIVVSGMAYPGATVTLMQDGQIVATTVADPGAAFSVTLNSLMATHYDFSVYAQDSKQIKSAAYSFPVTLTDHVMVSVANIFLAPTIGVTNSEVKKGDPIGIFGTTAPNAQITLSVHSPQAFVESIAASASGAWYKQFDTSFLDVGDHVTFSRAVKGAQVTDQSASVPFIVGTQSVVAPGVSSGGYKRSDLNRDGKVDVLDLSILLFYWNKKVLAENRADINGDRAVNAIDLSIMLYDWTG